MASFYVIRRSRIEFLKFLHWNITLSVQKNPFTSGRTTWCVQLQIQYQN